MAKKAKIQPVAAIAQEPVEGFLDNFALLKNLSDILGLLKGPLDLDKIGDAVESVLSKLGLADLGTALDNILDAVAARKAARAIRPIGELVKIVLPRIGLERYLPAAQYGIEFIYHILVIETTPVDGDDTAPLLMAASEDGVYRLAAEGESLFGVVPTMGTDETSPEKGVPITVIISGVVWAIKLFKMIRDLRNK